MVKKYVKTCRLCQTKKNPWTKRIGMSQPIPAAKSPFERIGIDILGPFKRSFAGNQKVLVLTDYLTKWAIAKAVKTEKSEEIADLILEEVFSKVRRSNANSD